MRSVVGATCSRRVIPEQVITNLGCNRYPAGVSISTRIRAAGRLSTPSIYLKDCALASIAKEPHPIVFREHRQPTVLVGGFSNRVAGPRVGAASETPFIVSTLLVVKQDSRLSRDSNDVCYHRQTLRRKGWIFDPGFERNTHGHTLHPMRTLAQDFLRLGNYLRPGDNLTGTKNFTPL